MSELGTVTTPGAERRRLEHEALDPWLVSATRGLTDESYDRVRTEVTDHFHEALDAASAAGVEPNVAAHEVVAALGSARAARRQFRRTYLTTSDDQLIRSFVQPTPAIRWGIVNRFSVGPRLATVAACFLLMNVGQMPPPHLAWHWTALVPHLLATAVGVMFLAVAPGYFRRGRQRAALAVGGVGELIIWSAYFAAFGRHALGWLMAVLAATLCFLALTVGRAAWKLPPGLTNTDGVDSEASS
ncbi:MAG: hypothetical protein GKS06_10015 [Acidobacteria bacterium]|nr:hypothetical protein [Acidobacteriota bacterium]